MACPENSDLQICAMLSETGSGLGEFGNGATSNGGLTKFLLLLGFIAAILGIVGAVIFVVKKAISKPGQNM